MATKETVHNNRPGIARNTVSSPRPVLKTAEMSADVFKESLARWDNSKDEKVVPRTIRIEEHYNNARIPRHIGNTTRETKVSARLVTDSGELRESAGKSYRQPGTRNVSGWDQLNQFKESAVGRAKRLRESHGVDVTRQNRLRRMWNLHKNKSLVEGDAFSQGFDLASGTRSPAGPNNEYLPLMLGPFNRNQYLVDFQDQASKGFWEMTHDPIAKGIMLLILHFVVGRGFKVNFSNPLCQKRWDKFCQDNDWKTKMRKIVIDLIGIGESAIYDPIMGPPSMTLWDTTTIWEFVTDPRNIEDVYYAHRQWPTQYQLMLGTEYMKDRGKMPPPQEYVIEQVGPEDFLHIKANATTGEKRGRCVYFSALGHLKSFRDWMNSAVIRGMISNSFVVWWKINGSDADVKSFQDSQDMNTVPPPGSAWFTNDQVVPTLLQAKDGISGSDQTGNQLLAVIAGSVGVSPDHLGVDAATTRAAGITRSEPGWKMYEFLQQLCREVIEWQIGRVLWKDRRDGFLPMQQPRAAIVRKIMSHSLTGNFDQARAELDALSHNDELQDELDMEFDVIMPTLQPEDRSIYIKDLEVGHAAGFIAHRTAAEQYFSKMDGMERLDYDTEQQKRREEEEAGIVPSMALDPMGGQGEREPGEAPGDDDREARPGSTEDNGNVKDDNQGRSRR